MSRVVVRPAFFCAILLSVALFSHAQILGDIETNASHNNETMFPNEFYQLGRSSVSSRSSGSTTVPLVTAIENMVFSSWSNPCLTFNIPPRERYLSIVFGDFPPNNMMVGKVAYHYLPGFLEEEEEEDDYDFPDPAFEFTSWKLDALEIVYAGGKSKKSIRLEVATPEIDIEASAVSLPTAIFDQIVKDTDAEVFDDSDVHYAECKKVWSLTSLFHFSVKEVMTSELSLYSLDAVDLAIEENPPGGSIEDGGMVTKMCRLQIEDSGKNGNVVLGHPFLQKYLTTFTLLIPEERYSHGTEKYPLLALGESKAYLHWKKEMRTHHSVEQDWTDKMDKDWKREHKKNWGATVQKKKKRKAREYPGAEIKKKKIQKQDEKNRGIAFM